MEQASEATSPDVVAFLHYIFHEKRYSVNTYTAYCKDLEAFRVFLFGDTSNDTALFNTAPKQIRDWMSEGLLQGLSRRTLARRAATLRTYFRFARRQGWIEKDPTSGLRLPRPEKRNPAFLPQRILPKLVELLSADTTYFGVQDKTMVLLFLFTGMRRAELTALKVGSVDLLRKEVRVMGKRSKMRVIPLHPAMVEQLTHFLEEKEKFLLTPPTSDMPLFTGLDGEAISGAAVYRKVVYWLGMVTPADYRGPHLLRHSFATWMLDQGAGIETVRELLGHTSLAATQVYTHTSLEKLRQAYRRAHPKGGGE